MLEGIIKSLDEWSREHELLEQAIESCKISLRNCAIEEAESFPTHNTGIDILRGRKLSDIELIFDKQSLVFRNNMFNHPCIDTQIGLYVADSKSIYFRDLKPIGTYRLITRLDLEVDEDYLVLDDELKAQQ